MNNLCMEKARTAWGDLPDWVAVLAEACDKTSVRKVAKELEVSPASVSIAIRNCHHARLLFIESKVRAFYMDRPVLIDCPVLGEVTHAICVETQNSPFVSSNSLRVQLFRACRNGCIYNLEK